MLFRQITSLLILNAISAWSTLLPNPETSQSTARYIVTLKEGVLPTSALRLAKGSTSRSIAEFNIINGFSGYFGEDVIEKLRSHPDVARVEEDGVMHAMSLVTQTDAPWGIARLSSPTRLTGSDSFLNFTYTYDSSAGGCADIYVIDTGIYVDHSDFGGRARVGATFGGNTTTDANGHGTHCAATAVGSRFGVAKKAYIYSVKVLNDSGSGTVSDIISGLNWVISNASASKRPSVVLMSIGGSASTALDNAVTALTNGGIHVAVAAGNSNADAISFSPARVPSAITVGATNIADQRTSSSNYGAVVDLYAPGMNIISAWVDSPTSMRSISGSSSSAAHVAGLIAYLICLEGNVSPATMSNKLKDYSLKGVIASTPSGSNNNLAHLP